MYEEEIKKLREEKLKGWKINRLMELEDRKEVFLKNYEAEKIRIEKTELLQDAPSVTLGSSAISYC